MTTEQALVWHNARLTDRWRMVRAAHPDIGEGLGQAYGQMDADATCQLAEAVRTLQADLALARGCIAADEERSLAAALKAGVTPMGCDTADHLAETVLALRADLAVNAGMLARQCDLARQAEIERNEAVRGIPAREEAAFRAGYEAGAGDYGQNDMDAALARWERGT